MHCLFLLLVEAFPVTIDESMSILRVPFHLLELLVEVLDLVVTWPPFLPLREALFNAGEGLDDVGVYILRHQCNYYITQFKHH